MTMENNHNHQSSGFMNGLMLGIIIGAALVFFLGTKKGRQLLQTITDEGLEDIGELKALLNDEMDAEEEEAATEIPQHAEAEFTPSISKVKRFFKRKK